jgi:HSP20 family protein
MAIIRWEPARELQTIQQEMNRLFGSVFDGEGASPIAASSRRWIPAMDLVEEDGHYVLHADLPGVGEDDVTVELEDNVLTVSGKRDARREDRRDGYRRVERATGSFSRSLTLPDGVDADSIEAHFENGVLDVRIPKPQERKPQRVAISVGAKDEADGAQAPGVEAPSGS